MSDEEAYPHAADGAKVIVHSLDDPAARPLEGRLVQCYYGEEPSGDVGLLVWCDYDDGSGEWLLIFGHLGGGQWVRNPVILVALDESDPDLGDFARRCREP